MNKIVTGLGFGDEGKGVAVALLANRFKDTSAVVKYTGGCQCAHNVIHADGRHHLFSQWGSASFEGVPTYIGPNFLFSPTRALVESKVLESSGIDAWGLLHVDYRARIVTPYHAVINRMEEEARGDNRHGSCGAGIGVTVRTGMLYPGLEVKVDDLRHPDRLYRKLLMLMEYAINFLRNELGVDPFSTKYGEYLSNSFLDNSVKSAYSRIAKKLHISDGPPAFARDGSILFEGSQGMLIDETRGFNPHTTWADLSPKHARFILDEMGMSTELEHWPVIRSYMSRHGAGPLPSETAIPLVGKEVHNEKNEWQGPMRMGMPDFPLWRSSLLYPSFVHPGEGVKLIVTHMDQVNNLSLHVDFYTGPNGARYDRIPLGVDAEGLKAFRPIYKVMPYFAHAEEALEYYVKAMPGSCKMNIKPGDWTSDPCPTRRIPIK